MEEKPHQNSEYIFDLFKDLRSYMVGRKMRMNLGDQVRRECGTPLSGSRSEKTYPISVGGEGKHLPSTYLVKTRKGWFSGETTYCAGAGMYNAIYASAVQDANFVDL